MTSSIVFKPILRSLGLGSSALLIYDYYYGCEELTRSRFARALRTAFTVSSIVLDYKISSRDLSDIHQRSADKLLYLAKLNKGVYIKLAQHVAAMDYLLPIEYVNTMRVLHNEAPSSTIHDVLDVIKDELDVHDISSVFSSFATEPTGTASLAQVHFATVARTGEPVAVKVQHKEVRDLCRVDLLTVKSLCNLVTRFFPDVQLDWLRDIMNESLPLELDFKIEGHNAERTSKLVKGLCEKRKNPILKTLLSTMSSKSDVDFEVPKIHWDLTTKRVLVMKRCFGCSIDEKEELLKRNIHPSVISKALGDLYGTLIFETGFVHADPHPGNLLVSSEKQSSETNKNSKKTLLLTENIPLPSRVTISILDHGLYCQLTTEFRQQYALLWEALLTGNASLLKTASSYFGIDELSILFACIVTGRTQESIQKGVRKSDRTESEMELLKSRASGYFPEITQVLQNIPKELVLILKTNDRIRAIQRALELDERCALLTLSKYSLACSTEKCIADSRCLVERLMLRIKYHYKSLYLYILEALCC